MIEDRGTMGLGGVHRRIHAADVLASEAGILRGEADFDARDRAPRWAEVRMTDRTGTEGEDCMALADRAVARRDEDGAAREAACTSTRVRQQDGRRLIHHQPSPVGTGSAAE